MKVLRHFDHAEGWAVEMAGAFVFRGVTFPAGSFVVQCEGERAAVLAQDFYTIFTPVCEAVA